MTTIWSQPPPTSRRRSLGRDEIVAAAIALADEGGVEALTMKALAIRLGPVTPMALYRYVHSKECLVDLMLDAAAAMVPLPASPGPDWRTDLHAIAVGTHRVVRDHPWVAALVHTRAGPGPHAMLRLEFMLRVLVERGASVGDAMTFAALIDRHVFGSGLQEAQEARFNARQGTEDTERLLAAIAVVHDLAAADGRAPLLTSWLAQPPGGGPDEQFELGLAFILDGIADRLATDPAAAKSKP